MAQSKLEEIGIRERKDLLPFNFYQTVNNEYSSTHKNARSDGDNKGKGTGLYLDTFNGGSDADINGSPNYPGSGRNGQLSFNEFNVSNPYKAPDTTGNIGQYRVNM